MPKYAIDYSGYLYVTALDEEEAASFASEELSVRLPYKWAGGDWELVNVEEVND